jgi:hypothetical protein
VPYPFVELDRLKFLAVGENEIGLKAIGRQSLFEGCKLLIRILKNGLLSLHSWGILVEVDHGVPSAARHVPDGNF